jgi:ATP-dependent Lon protease
VEKAYPIDGVAGLDLHVHFPSAATPKDGPSAGAAITTAIVSCLGEAIVHPDVAIAGEISLQGSILPVGGIKEKLLAANR